MPILGLLTLRTVTVTGVNTLMTRSDTAALRA